MGVCLDVKGNLFGSVSLVSLVALEMVSGQTVEPRGTVRCSVVTL